jgi:hypothetical protein
LVIDPNNSDRAITRSTLYQRKKVEDPDTGEIISRNALYQRKKVEDPDTGEMISRNAFYQRKQRQSEPLVIDPNNSDRAITKNALYQRKKVEDPDTGEMIPKSTLYGRQRRKRQKKVDISHFTPIIPNQNNVINIATDTEHDDEVIQQALLNDAKEQDGDKKPRAK